MEEPDVSWVKPSVKDGLSTPMPTRVGMGWTSLADQLGSGRVASEILSP